MDYEKKYLKYKTKYLDLLESQNNLLSGGGKKQSKKQDKKQDKFDEILNFIKTSNKNKIQKELLNIIQDKTYCPEIIGEGHFGKAYVPEVNKTFPFKIGNNEIELPIIIKENKNIENVDARLDLEIINNMLYISGNDNITTEVLILMFVRKLWNKTVHLPLILGYGTCSKTNMVDRIITLKHGLPKPIEIDLTGKIYNEIWGKPRKEPTEILKNSLATLRELFEYMYYKKNKNGSVELPNGITCKIAELFDYICISYLATHQLLTENNIVPSDMHAGNIFIHWLNDNSYYEDKNIKNLEEIIYKVGRKYYKIKTFGFVIILGDVGTFVTKIKKDVILVGQAWDIKENYKLIERRLLPEHTNTDFIFWNMKSMTPSEIKKTVANDILNSEPYCSYPMNSWYLLGWDISYLDKLKSTIELLSFFDEKYGINEYIEKDNNILITVKKYDIY
jgi:hypothetical protein